MWSVIAEHSQGVAVMDLGTLIRPALLVALALVAGQAAVAQDVAPAAEPEAAQPAAPEAATEAVKELKYSNKWRIEVKEGANNDGLIRLRLTPQGEAAIDVTISVRKGRSENGVARDIEDALRALLDKKRFKVEIDDGEDVLVKKKGGPDFALELVESTLKGTRLDLERE
jgi:hypothetical protein